jgi:hypothetical protein
MRNQPEPIAVNDDHHDDYYGNYSQHSTAITDREEHQPDGRQLVHTPSDSATGTD